MTSVRPGHLALRADAEQIQQRELARAVEVDRTVEFRQPQCDSMPAQDRGELVELLTVERAFVFAHHDRVETAYFGEEPACVRPVRPGDPAGGARIEVFGDDASVTCDQIRRCRELPVA